MPTILPEGYDKRTKVVRDGRYGGPMNWGELLNAQLEFYWDVHLRPRLDGLTDEEYLWEPVDGCWSVRQGPDGRWVPDGLDERPEVPPFTTIAWRLIHVAGYVLGNRASAFFGDGTVPEDAGMWDARHVPQPIPGTAKDAIDYLERAYRRWHDGVAALSPEALVAPLGPRGEVFREDPMAGLIVHINREVMHHGGEIGVLRDLYRARMPSAPGCARSW
jgi:DinB superfamily